VYILILASFLAILFNSQASAEKCPDFFRFVDFGLEAADGTVTRGGPTFRAESFDGQALLIRELSVCRGVRDLAVDGRGNPVPVVASVNYNPEGTGIDMKELRLMLVDDLASETERGAAAHRAKLERPGAFVTRGSNYLCASLKGSDKISCQLTSPFGGNFALVVYCDALECKMPVLAVKENVIAVSTWLRSKASPGDHKALASEIVEKIQKVHGFLAPLSS
jgi:hypothetical protein